MSSHTPIEWADATVNFWAGCTKVSPACDHCYAERMAGRLWKVQWGPGKTRKFFLGAADSLVQMDRKAKREGTRPLVFINSLADLFDNEVDDADRMDAFEAMSLCTELTFLALTKRIGNVERYLQNDSLAFDMVTSGRVWLGITVVNQEEVDRDVPKLLQVPAAVRFLSIEPMLAPVSLRWLEAWPERADGRTAENPSGQTNHLDGLRCLDWVICGGESGPGARPMHPDWARRLRDQCAEAGTPFLFKQWGEFTCHEVDHDGTSAHLSCIDFAGGRCALSRSEEAKGRGEPWWHLPAWPGRGTRGPDGIPPGVMEIRRVGKKAAGRLLDGIEHNGFPERHKPKVLA